MTLNVRGICLLTSPFENGMNLFFNDVNAVPKFVSFLSRGIRRLLD